MICILVKVNNSESEFYWKFGDPPVTNAERVVGIQANDEELNLILKIFPSKFNIENVYSWFGIDAKKISILIGAAK